MVLSSFLRGRFHSDRDLAGIPLVTLVVKNHQSKVVNAGLELGGIPEAKLLILFKGITGLDGQPGIGAISGNLEFIETKIGDICRSLHFNDIPDRLAVAG